MSSYHYIIVGAGSAGCVLANRLSQNPNNKVCLVEAGPADKSALIHTPLGVIGLMHSKTLNWQFNSDEQDALAHRKIFNPRGKTLGGSSSINAMLYTRGQAEDYDHWQALGNQGWAFDNVLPYFKSTQHQERGEDQFHGINGELNVTEGRSNHPVCQHFVDAAINAGYPANNDFNGESQLGVGKYQVTQINGQRCSAAKAFLDPVKHRTNLTIITDTLVERVLLDEKTKTALGVQLQVQGERQTIYASKEVILSAGAYGSPQILMLSGIGDLPALSDFALPAIHQLAGVGKNLQDHVDALVVNHYHDHRLLSLRPRALWHHSSALWQYHKKRTGVLTSSVAEAGGFICSSPDLTRPDLQLHFIPGAMDDHGRNINMLFNYGVSLHVCLLRPQSRGWISLNSAEANAAPKIVTNMLSNSSDLATMILGVKRAREILAQPPLKAQLGDEIFPGKAIIEDEEIASFLRQKANTIYHPVGTCKMGQDDMAVVDNRLKVHGIANLRVIDASIMPTLVSGNTNAPTIMIAAKGADMILQDNS